jgi:hypothetical protein
MMLFCRRFDEQNLGPEELVTSLLPRFSRYSIEDAVLDLQLKTSGTILWVLERGHSYRVPDGQYLSSGSIKGKRN